MPIDPLSPLAVIGEGVVSWAARTLVGVGMTTLAEKLAKWFLPAPSTVLRLDVYEPTGSNPGITYKGGAVHGRLCVHNTASFKVHLRSVQLVAEVLGGTATIVVSFNEMLAPGAVARPAFSVPVFGADLVNGPRTVIFHSVQVDAASPWPDFVTQKHVFSIARVPLEVFQIEGPLPDKKEEPPQLATTPPDTSRAGQS